MMRLVGSWIALLAGLLTSALAFASTFGEGGGPT